jgi:hypothetical protein
VTAPPRAPIGLDVRHAPARLDRLDNYRHPCGADCDGTTRTAYRPEQMNCPDCAAAERALQQRMAASTAANAAAMKGGGR